MEVNNHEKARRNGNDMGRSKDEGERSNWVEIDSNDPMLHKKWIRKKIKKKILSEDATIKKNSVISSLALNSFEILYITWT